MPPLELNACRPLAPAKPRCFSRQYWNTKSMRFSSARDMAVSGRASRALWMTGGVVAPPSSWAFMESSSAVAMPSPPAIGE